MAIEPDVIRNGETRSELILGGIGALPRVKNGNFGWTFNGHDYSITRVGGDKYGVVLDTQVRDLSGNVVFDDRVVNRNPPLLFTKPDATTVEDYFLVLRQQLDAVASFATKGFKDTHVKRVGSALFSGDTLAVRAATTDGRVSSNNATFATMATGSGLTVNTSQATDMTRWGLVSGTTYVGDMYFCGFDTSPLTSVATITAAVLTLYAEGTAVVNTNSYSVDARYKDWSPTVTTADWFDPRAGVWNALVAGGLLAVASWVSTSGTANNLSDSGVYTSISKTASTFFVVGLSGMNASTPTNNNHVDFNTADQTGTTTDPLFTVTYTLPSGTPAHPYIAGQAMQRMATR